MKHVTLVLFFMCSSVWAVEKSTYRVIDEVARTTPFPPVAHAQSRFDMRDCKYREAEESRFWTKVASCAICGFVLYWWWSAADAEDEPFMNFVFET